MPSVQRTSTQVACYPESEVLEAAVRDMVRKDDRLRKLCRSRGYDPSVDEEIEKLKKQLMEITASQEPEADRRRLLGARLRVLSRLFREAWNPVNPDLKRAILEEVERIRKDIANGTNLVEMNLDWLALNLTTAHEIPSQDGEPETWGHLHSILKGIALAESDYGRARDDRFLEIIGETTKEYLKDPSVHTPWLTGRLLVDLLDGNCAVLRKECTSQADPLRVTSAFPTPWGRIIPSALSFLFFVSSAVLAAFLFSNELAWAAWLIVVYLGWHYFSRFRRNHELAKARIQTAECLQLLAYARDEIAREQYDNQEVARRLRELETKGYFVPSNTFSLLKIAGRGD